jgi:hypothetical protein
LCYVAGAAEFLIRAESAEASNCRSLDERFFFISYNKADRTWAEWIAWQLKEARYSVHLQAWDFRPGSNFVLKMQRAP